MYRKDLYSNTSESSRKGGGSWVYINGELYHYGRPGMEWGKHLPGTDWWKAQTAKVANVYKQAKADYQRDTAMGRYGSNRTVNGATRARATVSALRKTASYLGKGLTKYGKKLPGHMVNEARNIGRNIREDARDLGVKAKKFAKNPKGFINNYAKARWAEVRSFIQKFHKDSANRANSSVNSNTLLSKFVNSQAQESCEAYAKMMDQGGVTTSINTAIQSAQYNIVNGINSWLQSKGWDDEVDDFMRKLKKQTPL